MAAGGELRCALDSHYLWYTAAHCNTLQHTAAHCSTLQHTAAHCHTLQHTAAHCNTLQHTATHCNALQHTATHCNTLQHTATHSHSPNSPTKTGIFHKQAQQHRETTKDCHPTRDPQVTHYNKLQQTATNCNKLQHTVTLCSSLIYKRAPQKEDHSDERHNNAEGSYGV